MKKFLCMMLSVVFLFSLSACGKKDAEPAVSPADQVLEEEKEIPAAEEEKETEYTTYQIPGFDIAFDCPAELVTDAYSNTMSEDEVFFTVEGKEEKHLFFTCARIASLDELVPFYEASGVDSSILFEEFKSLDVAAAIEKWKNMGYETFELIDSVSQTNSYGFSYIGKEESIKGQTYPTQLYYRYKNYGDFVDTEGIVMITLSISVPYDYSREAFDTLCKDVTNSIRLSENGESTPMVSEYENWNPALRPLQGSTPEEKCREIAQMFFEYAANTRYTGPDMDIRQLVKDNETLLEKLNDTDGVLDSTNDFMSEITFQDFGESETRDNEYFIDVIETRIYDDSSLRERQYAHTFFIVIENSEKYWISVINSVPVASENGAADMPQYIELEEIEGTHGYGANAQIPEIIFNEAVRYIKDGDEKLAQSIYNETYAKSRYEAASVLLEGQGYQDTPLYELAVHRYLFGPYEE